MSDLTSPQEDRCPQCGAVLAPDAPEGLCIHCLAQLGLGPEAEEGALPQESLPDDLQPPAEPSPPSPRQPPAHPNPRRGTLEIRCPQCARLIELPAGAPLSGVCCESCGTHFDIVDPSAVTEAAADLGRIGPFQILEPLGSGAFIRRRLPAAEAEKFLREARAAAQLHHPNIVSVHEVGRDEELIYIVCDYVEGVSLADWLSGNRMSAREAAAFCVHIRRRLPAAEAEKFLREARAAAQLHHPNIVSVHEVGRDEELIYNKSRAGPGRGASGRSADRPLLAGGDPVPTADR